MLFVSLNFMDLLGHVLSFLSILTPFMVGFAIAFIFNGPMVWIERFLFEKPGWLKKIPIKIHRPISYILTLTGFTVLFTMILTYIIPQLYETIRVIVVELQKPEHWNNLIAWIEGIIGENEMVEEWIFGLNINWADIETTIVAFFEQSWVDWVQNTFTFASSLLSGLTTVVIGFFFSVYALLQKEYVISGLHKVVNAFFSKDTAAKIFHVGTISNRIFSHFLYGQGVEAIILGAIFFVVLGLLNYPYVLLISVLIGVTALVPMVGAFIGMFFGFFIDLDGRSREGFVVLADFQRHRPNRKQFHLSSSRRESFRTSLHLDIVGDHDGRYIVWSFGHPAVYPTGVCSLCNIQRIRQFSLGK